MDVIVLYLFPILTHQELSVKTGPASNADLLHLFD